MVRGFMIGSLLVGLAGLPARASAEGTPAVPARSARPAPSSAPAARAPATPASPSGAATDRERARLAAELDRANGEIDALKRSPRGIRDDYRLRDRMADAEALARRLTELDAKTGRPHAGDAPASPRAWPTELPVVASDDRADLEAKADILTDQAGRLTTEANRLDTRIRDLRARHELRRRAGQLERDPFSPLEQPKSRIMVTSGRDLTSGNGESKSAGPGSPTISDATAGGTRGGAGPTAPPPGTTGAGTGTFSSDVAGSLAAQLRNVLDPSALAEIRRLEAPGSAPSNLAALESALGTLRGRSAQLTRNAAALRARAAKLP